MLDPWLRKLPKKRLYFVLVNENAFRSDMEDVCLSNWTDEQMEN